MIEKPEKIILTTIELIAENGFHNTPTSLISKQAGVGIGTIYRYFDNKEKLITEAFAYIRQCLLGSIFEARDESLPDRACFIRLFSKIADYSLNNETHHKFLEQYFHSPYGTYEKRLEKGFTRLEKIFESLKEQNLIKKLDNQVLFSIAFGPLLLLLKDHFSGDFLLDKPTLDMVVAASWDAIKL